MKVFKQVPQIVQGHGSFSLLKDFLEFQQSAYNVYIFDHVHKEKKISNMIPKQSQDIVYFADTSKEPTTEQIDEIRDYILKFKQILPNKLIGIGGGSVLDITKAVSVLLTNPGSSSQYQGWDLVTNQAISKIGIPTLSGTGAEASRTAVLTSKEKKMGINSDQSIFDTIILDPNLIKDAPNEQRFYTGMDCYIHSIESIEGSFINEFGKTFATRALNLTRKYFLHEGGTDEDLMIASYFGGASVANSEVGVVHAMSYGLSLELGLRHGIANCIVLNQLHEFYEKYMEEFYTMLQRNYIKLPKNLCNHLSDKQLENMIDMTLRMERPLTSALGKNWKDILTREKIKMLYKKM